MLLEFVRAGFQPLREHWQRRHVHQDCAVQLTLSGGTRESGVARGVGADGALLLETTRGVRSFHSGDVSLRTVRRA